ncbi:hypothetical protein PHLGIDRAFT_122847 [Phlebiopsis gigantea 11061_1 CR5-6]|uniref:Uncharacterized protein n=1 Tax=Phlebiopsis gigantea (strain 11061_1 CR5-6) TaxID=745531 RepID=A0A0C3RZP9_PHLG1|nr:hypothetical protein PHLGIDRAFT_122847 [Phlebiopsis gigantea 11061_1 CR5-6]
MDTFMIARIDSVYQNAAARLLERKAHLVTLIKNALTEITWGYTSTMNYINFGIVITKKYKVVIDH